MQGRYSFVGAQPVLEVVAHGREVSVLDHGAGSRETLTVEDPLQVRLGFRVLVVHWRGVFAEYLAF